MLNITEAILKKKGTYDVVEPSFLKRQIMYQEYDAKYFNDHSLYREDTSLIFDLDQLEKKNDKSIYIKNAEFSEVIEDYNINNIIFRGKEPKHFEMYCEYADFSKVTLINESNNTIYLKNINKAKYLKGDIFIVPENRFRFDKPKENYYQIFLQEYFYPISVELDYDLSRSLARISVPDKIEFIEENYGMPEGVLFEIYGYYFIKGITNIHELSKFKNIPPYNKFKKHNTIPKLFYYTN